MNLSVLIQIAASISSVAAATTFYPFSGDLYAYGDMRLRKISKNEPYQLGGTSGHIVSLTLGDDGTLKDSDGDYVYYDESSKSQFIYPSVNGTVLTGWGIKSGQLTYKDSNTFVACPLDDLHATFASGLSNCNQASVLFPQQLTIDASITAEAYDAAPRFTLHANGTGLGDGFLKISNLAPYGYSIGEGDEVATFTLLPNHKVFDQNDFLALNNYGGYAQPLGEIVRYGGADATAKTNFVLTSDKKYLYTSTQPNTSLGDNLDLSNNWYLCKNGTTPFVSFTPQCDEQTNTALDPPPTLLLELNFTGGAVTNDTTSLSVPSSGSATLPPSSGTDSATKTKTGDSTNTGAVTTPATSITGATAAPTNDETSDAPATSISGVTASPTTTGQSGSGSSAYASAYALAVASGKSGVSASAYAYAYAAAISCGNGSSSAIAYAQAFASTFTSGSYAYAEAYAYAYAQCGYVKPPTYQTVTVTVGAEATTTGEICYCHGESTITTYVPLPTTTVYTECANESTTVVTTTCWPVVDSTSTYYPLIAETATVTVSPVTVAPTASAEAASISTYENNAAGQVASFGAILAGVALAVM